MKIYIRRFIAEGKVSTFLTGYNGMKFLEFSLLSVWEALRNDPQEELLIEKTPSVQNYDFVSEESFFPNIYDCNYPHIAKEEF